MSGRLPFSTEFKLKVSGPQGAGAALCVLWTPHVVSHSLCSHKCFVIIFVCSVTFHFSFSTECRSRKLSHQGGDTDTAQDRDKLGHKEFLIIWSTLIKKITFILIFVNSAAACWQVYWSINRPECFWLYSAQLGFYSSNKTSTSTSMVASMIYKMFQVC